MLAVAVSDIQSLYESQPLLAKVGNFPLPSTDVDDVEQVEEENGAAA